MLAFVSCLSIQVSSRDDIRPRILVPWMYITLYDTGITLKYKRGSLTTDIRPGSDKEFSPVISVPSPVNSVDSYSSKSHHPIRDPVFESPTSRPKVINREISKYQNSLIQDEKRDPQLIKDLGPLSHSRAPSVNFRRVYRFPSETTGEPSRPISDKTDDRSVVLNKKTKFADDRSVVINKMTKFVDDKESVVLNKITKFVDDKDSVVLNKITKFADDKDSVVLNKITKFADDKESVVLNKNTKFADGKQSVEETRFDSKYSDSI